MALCLVAKRFPGDGVLLNQSGKTIRIARPTNGSKEVAGEFPKTAQERLPVPGCRQGSNALKGLGCGVNKPLMQKPRAPLDYERRADRDTAGNTFAAIRRSILLKILTSPLLPTRITPKPTRPTNCVGLLFQSGQLRKI